MPFPFYRRLSRAQKATYRKSDALDSPALTDAALLQPLVRALGEELAAGDRRGVTSACNDLALEICEQLGAGYVRVDVQDVRPADADGELHGLYELPEEGLPHVTLWMRTAAKARVVAFRTFLRTFLHELCHHLDFVVFRLDDSFHTEGFFRRESALVRQLLPEASKTSPATRAPKRRRTAAPAAEASAPAPPPESGQLELPW